MRSLYCANPALVVYCRLLALLLCAHWVSTGVARAAISASNVLVLYNADDGNSGAGYQIADYYQQVHPGAHVIGLTGISSLLSGATREQISGADYLNVIRPQVLSAIAGINDSIDVIVTTKGLPLRIDAGTQPPGTQSYKWRRYSSLESELTRIDSIDSIFKLGDQFILTGFPGLDTTLASNPYYSTNEPFVRAGSDPMNGDIRLAARLDGHSVQTVRAMIDRAQQAFVVPLPGGPMVVADDDPSAGVDQIEDYPGGPGPGLLNVLIAWQSLAEQQIAQALGQPDYQFPTPFYQHNNTDEAITTAPGPVIGYVSHGIHDGPGGLEAGYTNGQLQFQLANGAIFQSHESYNAYSFDPSYTQGQGLVAQWLDIGGTAGLGHVEEPNNGPANVTNEDLLYQMLLPAADASPGSTGLTYVEAAWNATRQLSYVNTVVGDPLMRFQVWLPGDANLDGWVNLDDLAVLQVNWLGSGSFAQGDFNGDGTVNLDDLAIMQVNWLRHVEQGAVMPANSDVPRPPIVDQETGIPFSPSPIPEPSGLLFLASGGLFLSVFLWPRRCGGPNLTD